MEKCRPSWERFRSRLGDARQMQKDNYSYNNYRSENDDILFPQQMYQPQMSQQQMSPQRSASKLSYIDSQNSIEYQESFQNNDYSLTSPIQPHPLSNSTTSFKKTSLNDRDIDRDIGIDRDINRDIEMEREIDGEKIDKQKNFFDVINPFLSKNNENNENSNILKKLEHIENQLNILINKSLYEKS